MELLKVELPRVEELEGAIDIIERILFSIQPSEIISATAKIIQEEDKVKLIITTTLKEDKETLQEAYSGLGRLIEDLKAKLQGATEAQEEVKQMLEAA
jgi:hypothetical protein